MGDARKDALRVELHVVDLRLDSRIKLEFHGPAVTSDAGLVAYRELDETLELTQLDEVLRDSRRDKNTQHELVGLLRQSVYGRLAGYEDTNPDIHRDSPWRTIWATSCGGWCCRVR